MTKTAWVFPGQGSQTVGMGMDLRDIPTAKTKLAIAEQILGWSVLDICQGDEETLSRTLYTQPCLYVVESILAELLIDRVGLPQLVAGHSLGEYVALYVARVFDFASGLKLVKKRSELMDKAAGGKMAALMKFDRQKLEKVIEDTPNIVIANDNSSAQVVISGTPEAVETVMAKVKAKRAVILNVSGAFHSPLMQNAAEQFQLELESIAFADAKIPVLSNVEPTAATDKDILKQRLSKQMTGSVRWREIMQQLPAEEITQVVEVGPGKVLTGLLKRACRDIELQNISSIAELNAWANSLDAANNSVDSLELAVS
jgi:[acyl-carrier-protein] S-malonyltransferase